MEFKLERKIYLSFLIFTLIISALLLAFYHYVKLSLFLGFLIGSAFSYLIYEIKIFFNKRNFFVSNSKTVVFKNIFGFLAICFLTILLTVAILFINKNSISFYHKEVLDIAFYPINIITFLLGIINFRLVFLIITWVDNRKEKNEHFTSKS